MPTAAPEATSSKIEEVRTRLQDSAGYFAPRPLATAVFLALHLRRPLLLEGEPGVGKTEVAKALALLTGGRLIRLQCYEGLDVSSAVYEWDYSRQLLQVRLAEAAADGAVDEDALHRRLFGPEFLLRRPLLEAVDPAARTPGEPPPVLLIDELDRADEEMEAFLLELLSDFQVTVPEIGTVAAEEPPRVVITSNRTRDLHDALRRRCLYQWLPFPDFDRELAIVRSKVPEAEENLARQAVAFVQQLRAGELYKRPGVAETLDWLRALVALDARLLDEALVEATLGALLKYQDDIEGLGTDGVGAALDASRARAASEG